MYALFKDGKQVSKSHSVKRADLIEAYELGFVASTSPDFHGDVHTIAMREGCQIREIEKDSGSLDTQKGQ